MIMFMPISMIVVVVSITVLALFPRRPRYGNHYQMDMREYYNEQHFKQLVKQSGVKNIPEYSRTIKLDIPTPTPYTPLPSTGHWEDMQISYDNGKHWEGV